MLEKKHSHLVIVHTNAGTHVQVKAGNNQIVWTTEVYENPRNAQRAIQILRTLFHEEPRIVVKDERQKVIRNKVVGNRLSKQVTYPTEGS